MNRTDRSHFASWWWTVDRTLIAAALVLLVGGVVLSFAASPPVAERIHASDSFHFVKRHAFFFSLSLPVLFGVSFLSPRDVRRGVHVRVAVDRQRRRRVERDDGRRVERHRSAEARRSVQRDERRAVEHDRARHRSEEHTSEPSH